MQYLLADFAEKYIYDTYYSYDFLTQLVHEFNIIPILLFDNALLRLQWLIAISQITISCRAIWYNIELP